MVLAGVAGAVRGGQPNHLARGYLDLLLAVLVILAVASFALPMPAASRRYWRLCQAALTLFALSFGFAAAADLSGHPALGLAAGLALLLGLPPLVAAVAVYVVEHQRWQHGLTALLDLAILVVAVVAICAPPLGLAATGCGWSAGTRTGPQLDRRRRSLRRCALGRGGLGPF